MADSPRIEELKRRVHSDPASIAFAALAEEYRRAGRFEEAIETCTTGLVRHPSYLSAHVTLGRALIEVGRLPEARAELEYVLKLAPENLAAIRGLAEIHHRIGEEGAESLAETPTAPPETTPVIPFTETRETPPERPAAIPFKAAEEKPQPVAFASPAPRPMAAATSVPSVEMTAPTAADVTHAPAVDPALAGLEEFLSAIIRARADRAAAR